MTVRLFDLLDKERRSGRLVTVRDWMAQHPPADERFVQTLANVAVRVSDDEPFAHCVREFLDEFALRPTKALKQAAIDERPASMADCRQDAYIAALGEHLCGLFGLRRPAWTCESDRFLDRFWFVSPVAGFRALAMAESPAAFRRRGILIARGSLDRC